MSSLHVRPGARRWAAASVAALLAIGSLSACVKERGPAEPSAPPKPPWEAMEQRDWSEAQEILDDAVETADQYGIDLGVWVRVVGGPEEGLTANAGDQGAFYPASTIKSAVLATAIDKFSDDLSEVVTVDGDDVVPVSVAGWGQYTVGQLIQYVASYSCNTSANALIDAVGGFDVINGYLEKMGVPPEFHIHNKLFVPGDDGERNSISPEAAGVFMTRLQEAADGDPYEDFMTVSDARQLLQVLTAGSWNRTAAYVGNSTQKSGDTAQEANDMGILYTPGGAIAFGAMTHFPGGANETVDAIMANVGQQLYALLPAWEETAPEGAVPTWWNPYRPGVEPGDGTAVETEATEEDAAGYASRSTDGDVTGSIGH